MIGLQEHSDAPPPPPPSRAPELAEKIFAPKGWLHHELSLEHRPQQAQMARAVARALADDEPLLFEAGTGVGKSLAYLLPGIIHAVDQSRQMIVSTHTIALQEQIDTKDLPLCRRVFASTSDLEKYKAFKSAVLVGKSNYLCTTRLASALRDKHELFATPEHSELQRIAAWAETTREGLRHELSPPVPPEIWELVNADSSACARKYCDCEKCPYQRARARIRAANVVIVNHSLLFAHLNAGGASDKGGSRGVLFPDDFVVLDEGHTVPEVATEHYGLRLSSYGVDRMLKYLFNPKTKRGLLQKHGTPFERQLVHDCLDAAHLFFTHIDERILGQKNIMRLREPDFAEPWLDAPLLALIKAVRQLADRFDEGRERDELLEQSQRLKGLQASLTQFLTVGDEKFVYWTERTGRRQSIITLRTAPIDVAPFLRDDLLRRDTAVIYTSATLAMGGTIKPFQARIGAAGTRSELVASPFDFERNMRVYLATDIPLPSPQDARLALDALIDYLEFCCLKNPGGTLALFTSYRDMQAAADTLAPVFAAAGRPLLMQGAAHSRTELARQMRDLGNAILFGTESFWTGIDIAGPALSQVIITRLPFDVPTHPILEARTEHIRDQGLNPFNELTLPDALIKFRQGIGRLIRSTADTGVVTLLDSRLTAKAYGRQFLATLPTPNWQRMNRNNRTEIFQPYA